MREMQHRTRGNEREYLKTIMKNFTKTEYFGIHDSERLTLVVRLYES